MAAVENIKPVGPLATPEGRLSFPHFTEPEMTGKFPCTKYVGSLVMQKDADLAALKAACLTAAQGTWPDLKIANLGQIKLPFKNGDDKGIPDTVIIKCTSKQKPAILGLDRKDYVGPIKAGDVVRFSVTAWPFKINMEAEVAEALKAAGKLVVVGKDEAGNKCYWRPAVTFLLNSVQFRKEGPAFGGGGGGAAAFDDGDMGSAAPAGDGDIFG